LHILQNIIFILIGATWQKLFLEKFESHIQTFSEIGV
jgi:hypothetical protein